jgi:YlmC/YmxH family sporulation protein
MVRSSEIRQKEVINILDGRRLGVIIDMDFNLEQGRIESITVPGPARFMNFFKGDRDYVIPWNKIRKIGDDVILVELDNSFFSRYGDE